MRSAVVAAAFAAGVLAIPHQHQKRDVVYKTVDTVAYVTDVTTVTGSPTAAGNAAPSHKQDWPEWGHWSETAQTTEAPATTEQASPSVWSSATTWTISASDSASASPSSEAAPPSSSAAPPPETSSASPTGSSGSTPTSYSQLVVHHHNIHRQNHSAPNIEWDDSLAKSAQDIANTCYYAHNTEMDGGNYGQNIAAGVESNNVSAVITDLFYNGEVEWFAGLYGQDSPDMTNFEHWGHFSQIVWKETTHVGCATKDCTAQGLANTGSLVPPYFTVCNYKGAGNFANEYGSNIGKPLNHATAQWNSN